MCLGQQLILSSFCFIGQLFHSTSGVAAPSRNLSKGKLRTAGSFYVLDGLPITELTAKKQREGKSCHSNVDNNINYKPAVGLLHSSLTESASLLNAVHLRLDTASSTDSCITTHTHS